MYIYAASSSLHSKSAEIWPQWPTSWGDQQILAVCLSLFQVPVSPLARTSSFTALLPPAQRETHNHAHGLRSAHPASSPADLPANTPTDGWMLAGDTAQETLPLPSVHQTTARTLLRFGKDTTTALSPGQHPQSHWRTSEPSRR